MLVNKLIDTNYSVFVFPVLKLFLLPCYVNLNSSVIKKFIVIISSMSILVLMNTCIENVLL